MLSPVSLWGIPSVIFSRESAGGHRLCALREYQTPCQSGQAPARVNLSARQAKAQGLMIPATYGPSSIGSLGSANLQQSLENRLRARLDVDGSPEYALTWKHWDMPLGPPICALRASARRISGKDCSGWGTPRVTTNGGCPSPQCTGKGSRLEDQAALAGWVTPTAQDGSRGGLPPRPQDTGVPLSQQASLAGWPTPNCPNGGRSIGHVSEWKGNTPYSSDGRKIQLDTQAIARMAGYNTPRATDGTHGGPNQTGGALPADAALLGGGTYGFPAPMENRGALNPALSRWLMGYPVAWCQASILAHRGMRKTRGKPAP